MFLFLSVLLIAKANGLVIPTVVWWLFGGQFVIILIKSIGDATLELKKKYDKTED